LQTSLAFFLAASDSVPSVQAMNIHSSPVSASKRRWRRVATRRCIDWEIEVHRLDGRYAVIGCKKNNANEGCSSCASLAGLLLQLLVVAAIIFSFIASFIACFILLLIGA